MRAIKHFLAAVGIAAAASSHAAPLLSEGFDDISTLGTAGWTFSNLSTAPGMPWFQGDAGVFAAQSGAQNAYIGANFLSSGSGEILNVLVTPGLTLSGGETLSFYTRTQFVEDFSFDDNLAVLIGHKEGTNLIFDSQLVGVGPSLTGAAYPFDWQQFSALIPQQATPSELFIAFAYSSADAGGANYIGLDSVTITAVPEPQMALLLALGLGGVALARRRIAAQS